MNFQDRSFLIILFLIPFVHSAQQGRDSSKVKEIALKTEVEPDKDLSLELGSEKVKLITKAELELRSAPGDSGTVIGKLKKGVEVQQLDIIGTHYLICYNGKCGYVPKNLIVKVHKDELVRKTQKDSIPLKANKT